MVGFDELIAKAIKLITHYYLWKDIGRRDVKGIRIE